MDSEEVLFGSCNHSPPRSHRGEETTGLGLGFFNFLQSFSLGQRSVIVERKRKNYSESTSKFTGPAVVEAGGTAVIRQMGKHQNHYLKADRLDNDQKIASLTERTEDKPSNSETRPKEVVEPIPIQNQTASQKLQKMSNPIQDDRGSRGRKQRGKGKQGERPVFTLAEWEKKKAEAKSVIRDDTPHSIRDEDLAWRFQNQFDLEDQGRRARGHGSHSAAAATHDEGESSSFVPFLPPVPWQVQVIEDGNFVQRPITRVPYNEYLHLDPSYTLVPASYTEELLAYSASLTRELQRMNLDAHNANIAAQASAQPSQEHYGSRRDHGASGSRGMRKSSQRR